jgi:alpha-ketoglutarate-dependent 2,4-dichlorophenoxyacetate dioxygenase
MPLSIEPLHPLYAVRVTGLDMRKPVGKEALAEFISIMSKYAVAAVGHDEPPTNEQHIAFSSALGPLERGKSPKIAGTGQRVPYPEIIDQSNMDEFGEIYDEADRRLAYKRANRLWHTDMSFYDVRATYSLLSGHVVPPKGAETEFTDMRAAYDALSNKRKAELEGLSVEHCYWHSRKLGGGPEPTAEERASRPPARHPLVHVHAGSGRKTLYLASHASGIVGWPEAKARALLDELMAHATGPRFVYAHKWRRGDVLVWDNLCTMHRATPFDDQTYKRDMRRTTCRERPLNDGVSAIA